MQPSKHDHNFVIILPPKHKIRPKCPASFLCCILPTVHFPSPYLLQFQCFALLRCYLYQTDERVVWEPSEQQHFLSVPVIQPLTARAHTHTHTRTHARARTRMRTRTRTHTHAHTHARRHAHTRTRTHTRARTHTHTHAHTHSLFCVSSLFRVFSIH